MPGPDNPLGKYKMRLSKPTFLIHGTNEHGKCWTTLVVVVVFIYIMKISMFISHGSVGTRVRIINSPYKVAVYDGKMYLEAHMPLLEERH